MHNWLGIENVGLDVTLDIELVGLYKHTVHDCIGLDKVGLAITLLYTLKR